MSENMPCPVCDKPLMVLETRRAGATETRRRRACENGHRYTTRETINSSQWQTEDDIVNELVKEERGRH